MPCLHCSNDTENPKFCNRSCAVSYNNRKDIRKTGRKRRAKKCKRCETLIFSPRTICDPCLPDFEKFTKEQALTSDTQKYRRIREHARRIAKKEGLITECKVCGYSLHVETCHIKAIEDWGLTSVIADINTASNLIGLCPNHHWEFDNGFLKLDLVP